MRTPGRRAEGVEQRPGRVDTPGRPPTRPAPSGYGCWPPPTARRPRRRSPRSPTAKAGEDAASLGLAGTVGPGTDTPGVPAGFTALSVAGLRFAEVLRVCGSGGPSDQGTRPQPAPSDRAGLCSSAALPRKVDTAIHLVINTRIDVNMLSMAAWTPVTTTGRWLAPRCGGCPATPICTVRTQETARPP